MRPAERISRKNFVKTLLKKSLAHDAQAQTNDIKSMIGYHIDHPAGCCIEPVGEDSTGGAESENSSFGSSADSALVNRIVGFIGAVEAGASVSAASLRRLYISEIALDISVLKYHI